MTKRLDIDEIMLSEADAAKLFGIQPCDVCGALNRAGFRWPGTFLLVDVMRAVIADIKSGMRLLDGVDHASSGGRLADRVISNAEAAKLLGLSPGRVSQLASHFAFTAVARGQYHLPDVCRGYLDFLNRRDWYLGWSETGRRSGGRW
jgi:hypothetical protein